MTELGKQKSLLANSLNIEPSKLYVKDLQNVTNYYHQVVGLQLLTSTKSHVIFGRADVPVLELISKPEYNNAPIRSAGLFHNAIVFNTRAELAKTILNIFQRAPESFEGSTDHLVSEAFYFHDPENNGLELYFDRPRSDWIWIDGSVQMTTDYLDPQQYIINHMKTASDDNSMKLGHVHLRVGDVPTARKFYIDQLGFDSTFDMGSALFVSVGGYHHHMAMNTWQSAGASKRDPSLGLAEIKLILPNDGSIDPLANRLQANQLSYVEKSGNLHVNDPWNNQLVFAS